MLRKTLAVGFIFLFIVSSVTPMVIGYNFNPEDEELCKYIDHVYACNYFDEHNLSDVYSRERRLFMDHCNDNFKSKRELNVSEHAVETGLNEMIKAESTITDGGLMDSAWPMFCHDVRHTGRSPYAPSGNTPVVKWKFKLKYAFASSPAIDKDGTIYIGSVGYWSLYAVNPDGSEKWRYEMDIIESSPAISADGTIYVGCNNGKLYAINPDGSEKWKCHLANYNWVYSSPVIDDNGTIYVGSTNNWFYAINPNGTKRWGYKTEFKIYSSAAIDDDGIVYIGSHDGHLYAFNPNGTLKWKYKAKEEVKSQPAIGDDGTIYFGSWDDYLYALYPNGTLKWKFYTGLGYGISMSPTLAEDETIYIGTYEGWVYSIAPDGIENWRYKTGGWVISSPAIDKNGVIYFGSFDDNFYALNPDGTLKWKYKIGDNVESSPAIAEDGTIYFSSWDGYLYAIEVINNTAPDKPTITGPTSGKIQTTYTYTACTNDSDGNKVYYLFDWDDGTDSGWVGACNSGETCETLHTWTKQGIYEVKVKAKDEYDAESGWSDPLSISMPKNKPYINTPFLQFLENHPYMFPILRKIFD